MLVTSERTVAIAQLKAHLSAELRRVRAGESIIIMDHRTPVARVTGLQEGPRYTRRGGRPFEWRDLSPLISGDSGIQELIDEERADSW
jgi:prevent-host-death family protein